MAMSWDDYFTLSRSFSDTHSVDGVASPCSSLHSTQCSYEETPCVKVFLYNDDPMDIPIEPDLTVEDVLVMALDYGQEMDLIDHRLNDEHFVLFYFHSDLGETVADDEALVKNLSFENGITEFFLDDKTWYDFPVRMLGQNIVRNVEVHSLETLGETHEKVAQLYGIEPDDFYLIYRDDVIDNLRKSHLAYGFDINTTIIVKPRGNGGGKTATAKNGKSLVKQVMEKKKPKAKSTRMRVSISTRKPSTFLTLLKTSKMLRLG